ncbi:MAG TPA: NFACT RNA binding domain-containing protein [Lachnospiraceae bacterium]
MAFDGITVANLVYELRESILGGKIQKIAQPESDALTIHVKNQKQQYQLFLSANASLPLAYLSQQKRVNPMTAPNFCMLLRKHIGSATIIDIIQPDFERVLQIKFRHRNELGDECVKYLMIEIMGKHSNIIFCDENLKIIDSIKHVSASLSSVREVLPGQNYFIPQTQNKLSPYKVKSEEDFFEILSRHAGSFFTCLYQSFQGISPVCAHELCFRCQLDGDKDIASMTDLEKTHAYHTFVNFFQDISSGVFSPNIVFDGREPIEFASYHFFQYQSLYREQVYQSISPTLEEFYSQKEVYNRIRQKSSDLRKILSTALERGRKKLSLQEKQMKDTEKMDKYKVYGELIHTYGYSLLEGAKVLKTVNYYDNQPISIPLDPTLTPLQNAQKYFERYGKLKRTKEALNLYIEESKNEIEHLESVVNALDIARNEDDLVEIKEELTEAGYIKRKYQGNKKIKSKSKPLHFISSDGYHIYVGKNNYQNEELSFRFANGNDWWFHAKGQPGSHVIVKSNNEELPDRTFEEAGRLAAYFSKGKQAPKVEIDYTQKKNLKKPPKAKPGFVIYYTNYSLLIAPNIDDIKEVVEA